MPNKSRGLHYKIIRTMEIRLHHEIHTITSTAIFHRYIRQNHRKGTLQQCYQRLKIMHPETLARIKTLKIQKMEELNFSLATSAGLIEDGVER